MLKITKQQGWIAALRFGDLPFASPALSVSAWNPKLAGWLFSGELPSTNGALILNTPLLLKTKNYLRCLLLGGGGGVSNRGKG